MDNEVFQECLSYWKVSTGNQPFWQELANRFGYESGEILRSKFKRERQKRGIYREEVTNEIKQDFSNFPNVAVIDIETLPMQYYGWGLYDQNIGLNQIIEDDCFLSWSGKQLNSSEIYCDVLTSKEAIKRDSNRITGSIHNFISNCDIVIGHNYKNFDGKKINTYFLINNYLPLRYNVIDTLEIARNNLKMASNKLAYLNQRLGIRNKTETEGFDLWKKAGSGNKLALQTMLEYNKNDVLATENLYYKLRSFMPNHPNLAVYNELETEQCKCCLSTNLKVEGYYPPTNSTRYESVRCLDCGSLNRKKVNIVSKEKRKYLFG